MYFYINHIFFFDTPCGMIISDCYLGYHGIVGSVDPYTYSYKSLGDLVIPEQLLYENLESYPFMNDVTSRDSVFMNNMSFYGSYY
jgi:hypothetical protein